MKKHTEALLPVAAPETRRRPAAGRSALAQLVADSARVAAQRKLGETANRAGTPKSAPHGPGNNAHQELALLNAALAADEDEKKRF